MTTLAVSRRATLMLIGVTFFWAFSFPLVKTWQNAASQCPGGELVSSLTLLGLRMLIATIILLALQPRLLTAPTGQEHRFGAILGIITFVSLFLQFWGLARTSPALSAFLTSLGSAWVPILGWLLFRVVVPRLTIMGLGIGVIGVAILTLQPDKPWQLGMGESLTLLSSVLFAVQILLLERFGQRGNSAHFTTALFATTAILSLGTAVIFSLFNGHGVGVWLDWVWYMLSQWPILMCVSGLVLFSTVIAFHGMNIYQPFVPAGRAALIYLLEPVFATLLSIPWGLDDFSMKLVFGGGLILMGNYVVERLQMATSVKT